MDFKGTECNYLIFLIHDTLVIGSCMALFCFIVFFFANEHLLPKQELEYHHFPHT